MSFQTIGRAVVTLCVESLDGLEQGAYFVKGFLPDLIEVCLAGVRYSIRVTPPPRRREKPFARDEILIF